MPPASYLRHLSAAADRHATLWALIYGKLGVTEKLRISGEFYNHWTWQEERGRSYASILWCKPLGMLWKYAGEQTLNARQQRNEFERHHIFYSKWKGNASLFEWLFLLILCKESALQMWCRCPHNLINWGLQSRLWYCPGRILSCRHNSCWNQCMCFWIAVHQNLWFSILLLCIQKLQL